MGGWITVDAGTTVVWIEKAGHARLDFGIVAINPSRGQVLDDEGRVRELSERGWSTEIHRPSTYLSAAPGWLRCQAGVDEAGTFMVEWNPVIAWKVDGVGYLVGGLCTNDYEGLDVDCDITDSDPDFYWHTSEGEDRREEIARRAIEKERQRVDGQRPTLPPPSPRTGPPELDQAS